MLAFLRWSNSSLILKMFWKHRISLFLHHLHSLVSINLQLLRHLHLCTKYNYHPDLETPRTDDDISWSFWLFKASSHCGSHRNGASFCVNPFRGFAISLKPVVWGHAKKTAQFIQLGTGYSAMAATFFGLAARPELIEIMNPRKLTLNWVTQKTLRCL